MLYLLILVFLGLIFYVVRSYLENDAMIKARFLAKEYMQEKNNSDKDEIEKVVNEYDKLNDIGIKYTNFQLFSNIILKSIVLLTIYIIR